MMFAEQCPYCTCETGTLKKNDVWFVFCCHCGAQGPTDIDELGAIHEWNLVARTCFKHGKHHEAKGGRVKIIQVSTPEGCPWNMDDWCGHPSFDSLIGCLQTEPIPFCCPLEEPKAIVEMPPECPKEILQRVSRFCCYSEMDADSAIQQAWREYYKEAKGEG